MKKNEFIQAIKDTEFCKNISKKDIENTIAAISEVITEVIADEDTVKFSNIGTFSGITKPEREARNPATGSKVKVPEKHGYPMFKFSANMKKCD